jgi:hypothetical protein
MKTEMWSDRENFLHKILDLKKESSHNSTSKPNLAVKSTKEEKKGITKKQPAQAHSQQASKTAVKSSEEDVVAGEEINAQSI